MKSFHYSLEALLTLRQRRERALMENYAKALLARHQAFEDLASIDRELVDAWSHQSDNLASGASAAAVLRRHLHSSGLAATRRQRESALGAAERAANAALKELLASRQERKTVDQHRDRKKAEYAREQNRAEQRTLDELITRRVPLNPELACRTRQSNP